jgi:hypothetical protein
MCKVRKNARVGHTNLSAPVSKSQSSSTSTLRRKRESDHDRAVKNFGEAQGIAIDGVTSEHGTFMFVLNVFSRLPGCISPHSEYTFACDGIWAELLKVLFSVFIVSCGKMSEKTFLIESPPSSP